MRPDGGQRLANSCLFLPATELVLAVTIKPVCHYEPVLTGDGGPIFG